MGQPYIEAYLEHFEKSEPAEDFDGRNLLYNLCVSRTASQTAPD